MQKLVWAICALVILGEVGARGILSTKKDEKYLFKVQRKVRKRSGNLKRQKFNNTAKRGRTVAIQFTSRKRLYDHNILLRGLFSGRLKHKKAGDLAPRFKKSIFIDLGSAVLHAGGAPTVRDIYEDKAVFPYLGGLVASDINDYRRKKTEFMNIYRRGKNKLPFPVIEIEMSITRPYQFKQTFKEAKVGLASPLIIRSTNTGIDYYYTTNQLKQHLRAALKSTNGRDVLYLLNRFVLLRLKEGKTFELVGEISQAYAIEKGAKWRRIKWKKRKLRKAFKPRKKRILISKK